MATRRQPTPNLKFEKALQQQGCLAVAGVDEAGRGAWAGPVVAAAVVLPFLNRYYGINDSKLLTPLQREEILHKIYKIAVDISIGIVDVAEIDTIGIGRATYLAMRRAINNLHAQPQYILVDGFKVGFAEIPSQGIIDGDRKSVSIAAASIVAKVARDRIMAELHVLSPEYGFIAHKGYGTELHQRMIKCCGVGEWHRRSYQPIKDQIKATANLEIPC